MKRMGWFLHNSCRNAAGNMYNLVKLYPSNSPLYTSVSRMSRIKRRLEAFLLLPLLSLRLCLLLTILRKLVP